MVLTSHPFLYLQAHLIFCRMRHFYDMGTCLSLNHIFWTNFWHCSTLLPTNFLHLHTLLWTNIRTQKVTNTKKTRKKDEGNTKDTRNFAYFSSKQRTNHRAKIARWFMENQWAKLDHWKAKGQNDPMKIKGSKRAFGLVENQPHHFVPRWREVTNFIAGCDEVALKNATS